VIITLPGLRSRWTIPCRCAAQRVGDLRAVAKHLLQRKRTLLEPLGQRLSLDQLHHEEVRAVLAADVEEGADVRVVQGGDGPRLTLEAGAQLLVGGKAGREYLDRHVAPESRVARPIDFPHAAGAERGDDLVGAKAGAGSEWHPGNLHQLCLTRQACCHRSRWSPIGRMFKVHSCPCLVPFITTRRSPACVAVHKRGIE